MKKSSVLFLLMCLPMMLWAQGQLTAFYAKVDIENYEKGQLIVDTNDPINRMVDFNKSLYRYEGDEADEEGYYSLFDKSQITVKKYQMSPLPVSLVRNGATFQSREGFEIRIFLANANGHGFYSFDDNFQPYYDAEQTAAHQQYYVLSGRFQCVYDPDGFFFEEPLEVEDGNIKLYINGSEICYTSDDPDNVRYRPYKMGFLEEKWSAPEDYEYGVSAYDDAGNLLVDATRIVDIPTTLSIAYIEAEDALYVDGILYYRQK
jgi:hypothetical protein